MNFLNKKYQTYFLIFIVFLTGYIFLLGTYPLLDVDETRYVLMAKEMLKTQDFMTLYLNQEYFFEKPPLFFWLECLSFKMFNISEFTARLPIVLLSLLPLGLLFNLTNKIKGLRFAFLTSIILLTSIEYAILTKVAILDSVYTSFLTSSILCYFYTFFTEKNKKLFWLLSYAFMALAVLSKGLPGVLIPFLIITISSVIFKTYKETLKNLPLGLVVFLLIVLPWHVLMLKTYPDLFYSEYIYKHHILRFLGSNLIHRNEPCYFYLLTLLWGFLPHTFMLFAGVKKIKFDKFIILNFVSFCSILIFFSLSGAKLITYILPVYPFLAVITAEIWDNYIEKDDRNIKLVLLILNSVFVFGAAVFPFVCAYFLKGEFENMYISQIVLTILSFYLIEAIIKNERYKTFIIQGLFFACLIGFFSPLAYKIDYSFGQNDLIKFAKYAKEKNCTISAYKVGRRYSLLYYSGLSKIDFQNEDNLEWLNNELNKENNFVVIRNKDIKNLKVEKIFEGRKYSIIKKEAKYEKQ